MADNVSLTAGDGTINAGADVIAGVAYPRVKLELGADGTVVDAVGGSGVNSTAVQRVTIATDDLIIASLATKLDTLITATDTVETKLQAIADDIVTATIATVAHDADATAINPLLVGGYASAAAPTAVSADGDAVREWRLRNGAAATVITAAGALIGGDVTNGLDVDVTRVTGTVTVANTPLTNFGAGEYETVAASATNQVIGPTGAAGDYLDRVIVSPATAGCGIVEIFDNSTSIAKFFGGGTTALPSLIPFTIPIGIISTSGAWKITTGANISCTAVGNFT